MLDWLTPKTKKNSVGAAVLAFFFDPIGMLYVGWRAALVSLAWFVTWFLALFGVAILLYSSTPPPSAEGADPVDLFVRFVWFGIVIANTVFAAVIASRTKRVKNEMQSAGNQQVAPELGGEEPLESPAGDLPVVNNGRPQQTTGKKVVLVVGVVAGSLVALAAFAGLVFVADQYKKSTEYDAWLALTEEAEAVMEDHNDVFNDSFSETLDCEPWERAWRNVGGSANESKRGLALVAAEMNDVSMLPWHSDLKEARDDYFVHMDAWSALYEKRIEYAAYVDCETSGNPPRGNGDISATFSVAERSALRALPLLFVGDMRDRVEQEFAY